MELLELVVDQRATLGEGPCWDPENRRLYWVDIAACRVHIYDPAARTNGTVQLDQPVGAIVLRKSGGAVVALQNGFHTLDLDTGETALILDPESNKPNNRFNDGKCDPKG